MKRKLITVMMFVVLLLAFTGCSLNINIAAPGQVKTGDASLLTEIFDANTFEGIVARNGRMSYTLINHFKDGTEYESTIYMDDNMYAMDSYDGYGIILIIRDNEAFGYDPEKGGYYNTVFVASIDQYKEENELSSFFDEEENEEIVSVEEKNGMLYIETFITPDESDESFRFFGYEKDDIDRFSCEYTVDAATLEILDLKTYITKDDQRIPYTEHILDRNCEEYVPDKELNDAVFGDDVRTATIYADAGTDRERVLTGTVTKGSSIYVYTGDEYYSALYEDKDCVVPYRKTDRTKDLTLYLKRRTDYSDEDNWAYFGIGEDKDADLFLICPTVDTKDEFNMSMDDEKTKKHFLGALNMERGIYEQNTRMYAPYYRHAAMKVYSMTPEEREPYLEYAYDDVAEAFEYYLDNENQGRPIVLAGFSQGADMCYRLLEDYFGYEDIADKLVAVYAIGWPCTEEIVSEFPQIRPAEKEDDIGVVISFDCEAPEVKDTFITPEGTKAYTINPLNWKTDETPADKSLNLGACFTDYDGNIKLEEQGLCGCYIDEGRGVVKVPELDPADYPAVVPNLPEGSYHIYDYQFFYRNLEENVAKRIAGYRKTVK